MLLPPLIALALPSDQAMSTSISYSIEPVTNDSLVTRDGHRPDLKGE
jgi:hypothetical protein